MPRAHLLVYCAQSRLGRGNLERAWGRWVPHTWVDSPRSFWLWAATSSWILDKEFLAARWLCSTGQYLGRKELREKRSADPGFSPFCHLSLGAGTHQHGCNFTKQHRTKGWNQSWQPACEHSWDYKANFGTLLCAFRELLLFNKNRITKWSLLYKNKNIIQI